MSAGPGAAGASAISGTLAALATYLGTAYFQSIESERQASIAQSKIQAEVAIHKNRTAEIGRLMDRQQEGFTIAFAQIAASCQR